MFLPVPAQVAEIHKASKDGQLYDTGGEAKKRSAQAEPSEPSEYDIPPASQVYSLKAKRVGAGFPKGSCLFQTATELMGKTQPQDEAPQPVQGEEQEPPSQPCALQDEGCSEPLPGPTPKASGGGGPSPEKKAKGSPGSQSVARTSASKKQQLLAAAARKDSQNITRFFCQRAGSPAPATSAPGAEDASPACGGVQETPPEKCTEEDGDRAQGRLPAPLQTEERPGAGPGSQDPPASHPGPPEETQGGKRPRPQQDDPESQAQKRPCPSAKRSVLAEAKGSIAASDQDSRNPTAQGPSQPSAPGIPLKEAANVVVKCLTPFYKEGKFASKVG